MSSQIVETTIIECNRLNSEEATTGNNSNPAQWTNLLTDTINLNAGDKVSMYGSFISERGAGSSQTVELKGRSMTKKSFTYTTQTYFYPTAPEEIYVNLRGFSGVPYKITTTEITEDITPFDNKATIILQYYKTMNLHSYVQLPRRYTYLNPDWEKGDQNSSAENYKWTGKDLIFDNTSDETATATDLYGRCFLEIYEDSYCYADYSKNINTNSLQLRNNNDRYTMMCPTEITMSPDANPFADAQFQDPEYLDFVVHREKKEITLPSGFNSAEFIKDEVTRQLQAVVSSQDIAIVGVTGGAPKDQTVPEQLITKSISTETYKPFWGSNIYSNSRAKFLATFGDTMQPVVNDPIIGRTASYYYSNYATCFIKRPELQETGRKINNGYDYNVTPIPFGPPTKDFTFQGSFLASDFVKPTGGNRDPTPFKTAIPYTKANCDKLKAFFDAQDLYPEIWESWTKYKTNDHYDETHTIDKTRFLHMNLQNNFAQQQGDAFDPDLPPSSADRKRACDQSALGCSEYEISSLHESEKVALRTYPYRRNSRLFLIYYDKSQKDTFHGPPDIAEGSTDLEWEEQNRLLRQSGPDFEGRGTLTYGCLGMCIEGSDPFGIANKYIAIYPDLTQGNSPDIDFFDLSLPDAFYGQGNTDANPFGLSYASDPVDTIAFFRKFGFDYHFSAETTAATMLWNGSQEYLSANYLGEQDNGFRPIFGDPSPTADSWNINEAWRQVYIGADNPLLNFDGTHFSLSDLHSPENLGQIRNNAGEVLPQNLLDEATDIGDGTVIGALRSAPYRYNMLQAEPRDGSDAVIKINPLEDYNDYCMTRLPYEYASYPDFTVTKYSDGDSPAKIETDPAPLTRATELANTNQEPYTIYDSKSGIMIADLGYNQSDWNESMWGLLGFSYEQVHGTTALSNRVDSSNITNLNGVVTNADVGSTSVKAWTYNQAGHPLYTDQLPRGKRLFVWDVEGAANTFTHILFPNIVEKTASISVIAQNLPTSMIRGYYTIRSDIISNNNFVGGQLNNRLMPIVGLVDKMNGQGDFYFGTESSISFNVMAPSLLSSVKVSIHDPDGSFASTSEQSSVLFKVDKVRNISFDVAQEILEETDPKKKVKK